jgi:hypothetical protein
MQVITPVLLVTAAGNRWFMEKCICLQTMYGYSCGLHLLGHVILPREIKRDVKYFSILYKPHQVIADATSIQITHVSIGE